MLENNDNLQKAQDLKNLFDDKVIRTLANAKVYSTSSDGSYEIRNLIKGNYIIRVTGMGGMVIKFSIPSNDYPMLRIQDMPADYYYVHFSPNQYVQKN